MFDCVPSELISRPQWVLWRWELDGKPVAPRTPKATKVPYNAHTGRKSSSTNPKTWAPFDVALAAVEAHHCHGIGFVFSDGDPYTGIDLDDCIDAAGTIAPWAWQIVREMDTYTEVSPSGHGLKLWVVGTVAGSVKTEQIEIYSRARYFTVTGEHLEKTPTVIRDVNGALDRLFQSLQKEPKATEPRLTTAVDDTYLRVWADQVIESAVDRMRSTGAGGQHNTRLAMGRLLGGLIRHGLMNEDRAFRLIYDANIPDANDAAERKAIYDGIALGTGDPLPLPKPPPQPAFKDGVAFCPVHKLRLPRAKNGNGYKCHERDESTVSGWCDFWWKGEGYTEPAPQKEAEKPQKPTEYVSTKIDWRSQGITLRALQHKVFEPEKWIFEDIGPEGACLLAAKYKSKKSWLALALSLPVAMGGRALGRLQVAPGRVLYLDLEGKHQRIQKRTRAILGVQQVDWPENFHVFRKWPRADEGMQELDYWFTSYPDTNLVVIDVLASFRRPMEKHELMYQYDRDTVDPINELAEKHHAMILLVHHFNKGKHDDVMDSITGSTGLPSAVNTMWALRRDVNDSSITILDMRGRDLENDDPLALRWDTYLNMHVIEGPANEVAISTERRAIMKLLADDEPRTPKEIATELGRPVAAIQQLLRKLLNDGAIDKPVYGKYAIVRKPDQSDQTDQSSKTDQSDHSDRERPTLIGPSSTDQSSPDLQEAINSHSDRSDRYYKGEKKSEYPELDPIPREKHSTMFMMLASPLERNRKLAQERCEEYGLDYESLRTWALEEARKEREKAKRS